MGRYHNRHASVTPVYTSSQLVTNQQVTSCHVVRQQKFATAKLQTEINQDRKTENKGCLVECQPIIIGVSIIGSSPGMFQCGPFLRFQNRFCHTTILSFDLVSTTCTSTILCLLQPNTYKGYSTCQCWLLLAIHKKTGSTRVPIHTNHKTWYNSMLYNNKN